MIECVNKKVAKEKKWQKEKEERKKIIEILEGVYK